MFPINRYPRQPFQVRGSMHSIKRPARKEVGDTDNYNPLRKTKRSRTWGPATPQEDIEVVGDVIGEPLSVVAAKTGMSSPVRRGSETLEYTMTNARYENGRQKDPDCEETAVERQDSRRWTEEEKARRRFVSKFFKGAGDKHEDVYDKPEKRPWYRGKILYHRPFTLRNQLQATILGSWLNILLVAVPVGFSLNYTNANPIAIFFVNFVAVLPMAGLLGFAMDELRLRTGDVLGALIYMSFGNIVQSITSIFLLRSRQIPTLKTSLIGGILTLVLLNNGIAFFFGGLRRTEQYYNTLVATVFNGLLSVSIAAFVIPTASFYFSATPIPVITKQSRGTAIILMAVYGLYLYFELRTHADAKAP